MVNQNMVLRKTNEALHQQEEKSATDRARLFKGKAQCLSSDEFFQAVGEIETNRSVREAGKEAKKVERQRMKEERDEIEKAPTNFGSGGIRRALRRVPAIK
ncbi:hypothetical protein B0H14DRAFT_3855760 [Mycena olivaceomarginata]|nr:hypothetical protein B0H14DRAFT_3855760 [Mycena olivaceomarginata]